MKGLCSQKRWGGVIAILIAFFMLAFASAASPIVIKVNNDVAASALKGQTWRVFKAAAEKYLGNKVSVQIYDGASLYGQTQQLTALQQGAIQFIAPGTGVYTSILPSFALFELPYLIKSPEELEAVVNDPNIGGKILSEMESKNLEEVGVWLNGWRMVGAKKPILSLADLKGLKIRVTPGKAYVATFKALGANVTPMAWGEVPEALQQGVIAAVEPTANNWYADKLYEIAPQITFSDHIYSSYVVATNYKWWNGLPTDIRDGLTKALKDAQAWNWDHTQAENAADIKKMEAVGAQFHTLPQSELDKWQQIIQTNVWPEFQDAIGKKLLDDVIALGKKYQWATPNQ